MEAATQPTRALTTLLPEGTDPPADVPAEIFRAAVATFLDLRRLDMKELAGELGIGRATLYRRVRGRDHLLGQVMWWLTRHALARAVRGTDALRGRALVLAVVERFMTDVNSQPAFRRLLDAEPETALRILTSKHGPVQRGLVAAMERLLAAERAAGTLRPTIDEPTLAFVIVRIGESFLYADVIADSEPDVPRAVTVVGQLLPT